MTTLRQAAQQALEALENHEGNYKLGKAGCDRQEAAITAIKKALAQPEQKPMHPELRKMWEDYFDKCFRTQPEQEPTPWRDMVVATLVQEGINKHRARELADHFAAQRPWVGLTDDDRFEIAAAQHGWEDLLTATEAKLKEKNNG